MKHIHIVGLSPRSGTTLLMELMICSYKIDAYPPHEARIGKAPTENCDVYLTKSPKDIIVIGPLLEKVKSLYTIVVMRDPRDSAVSVHKNHPSKFYGTFEYWVNYIPFYKRIENHERVITVKYEDLVSKPNQVQKAISAKFGFLQKTDDFTNYIKNAKPTTKAKMALNGVRKIETKSIGNWKNYMPRIKAEMEKYPSVVPDIVKYGFETSADWKNQLDTIVADSGPQHQSLFSTKAFIQKKLRTQWIRTLKVWLYHTPLYLSFLGSSKSS